MSTTTSTNMGMQIPIVGQETGPQWATDLNQCLTVIDQHDHASGNGVQITPAGININTSLPMGDNALTNTAAIVLTAQSSYSTNKSLYVIGNEVYYRDGAGNQVQITNGGSVNAGAGSITGLPSGTASVTFTSLDGKYTFLQATSTAADIDIASVYMRNSTPNSTFALTLSPPAALASNYTVTLPALPVSTKIMTMDTSGNIVANYVTDNSTLEVSGTTIRVKDAGITGAKIAAATITGSNLVNNTLSDAQIAVGGIGTLSLGANAVTTAKINGGAVTLPKLAVANTVFSLGQASVSAAGAITTISYTSINSRQARLVHYGRIEITNINASATVSFTLSNSLGGNTTKVEYTSITAVGKITIPYSYEQWSSGPPSQTVTLSVANNSSGFTGTFVATAGFSMQEL